MPAQDLSARAPRVAGLFAGIGGIELGLCAAGYEAALLCEIEPLAQKVLTARFPGVELATDIRDLDRISEVEVCAAGFPCQDLSQAGEARGIRGARSGLVDQVFKLMDGADPRWLVLENVPFMLQLHTGGAMRHIVSELERLEMRWAYRIVDTRAFGLPQRRRRVLLVASRRDDPRRVLFSDDAGAPSPKDHVGYANGFYWTEGTRGLGWAIDAVPTLKGGSTIGISSPPAVWMPDGKVGMPDVRDGERLQGFDAGWTDVDGARVGGRWKLVGNAVSVPVAAWLGRRLSSPGEPLQAAERVRHLGDPWPSAAYGRDGQVIAIDLSEWPVAEPAPPLADFLAFPLLPLSERAAAGFVSRADRSSLHFPDGLVDAVRAQLLGAEGRAVA